MPSLVVEVSGERLDLSTHERLHWSVGRGPECDWQIVDPGISRYHATIFRAAESFYVLDHSLNGTHLTENVDVLSDATKVPSFPSLASGANCESRVPASKMQDTRELEAVGELAAEGRAESLPELHKSHAEFRAQELSSRLPRMAGYEAHALCSGGDLRPLLEMIYSAQQVETLVSMSRRLHPELRIVLVGCGLHALVFKD